MPEAKTIIEIIEQCGEIEQFEDGFYAYAPRGGGGIPSRVLRLIADHLDDKNAVWDEICKFSGEPNRLSESWVRGLKLIDATIVKLQAAGFRIHGGDDGGDQILQFSSRKAAIEMVASVDISYLFFQRDGYASKSTVQVVPGNGADAICDHSCGDEQFVAAMNTVMI